MQKKLLISTLLLLFVSSAFSASISVNPSYMHMGEIQKGETKEVDLYITTRGYDQSFDVRPGYQAPLTSDVFNDMGSVRPDAVSEQDISSWIRFPKDSYSIDPTTSKTVEFNGDTIRADGVIPMTIVVPQDAEPGYHAGSLKLDPSVSSSDQGFGTSVRGQTFSQFSFRVPGNANRNVEVTDVEVLRTAESQATLRTHVKNYGSVTTTVIGGNLKVLTMNGQRLSKVDATRAKIPPGKSDVVESYWRGDLEGGRYQVSGKLNYITGKATLGESFQLPDRIKVRDNEQQQNNQTGGTNNDEKDPVPLWLVVISLLVLGVLMYSFEIDPVWILGILGFLGIATFILVSSISNIYLVGLLISAGLLTYYGLM